MQEDEILLTPSHEESISLIPKPDKDISGTFLKIPIVNIKPKLINEVLTEKKSVIYKNKNAS